MIRGEIKERYLTTKGQILSQDNIVEAVDLDGKRLIEVKTLNAPVNMNLGSKNKVLNNYIESNLQNLQNEQSRQYMEASWTLNLRKIQIFCLVNTLPFMNFVTTAFFLPDF